MTDAEYCRVRLLHEHLRLPPLSWLLSRQRQRLRHMDADELISRRAAVLLGRPVGVGDDLEIPPFEGEDHPGWTDWLTDDQRKAHHARNRCD